MRRVVLCLLAVLLVASTPHEKEPTGADVARFVNDRPRAPHASRIVTLVLIDGRDRRRERRLLSFWKLQPDARWVALFALTPPELKHHAFLAHDPFDTSRPDDQWFYRPSRKRVQRIPALSRGESFLGSDFSFEDMKKEDRVEVDEFDWTSLEDAKLDGRTMWKLEQVPKTPELARQLGYGRIVNWIDPETALRVRMEFFDTKLEPLKVFELKDIQQVDGFWTAKRIEARNLQTGHRSLLVFTEVDYASPVEDSLFTTRTLEAERMDTSRVLRSGPPT